MKVNSSEVSSNLYPNEKTTNNVSMEDFLKIMTAELQNQDPMSSDGNNTDYVTQLAQFTMLDQLTLLQTSINQMTQLSQHQYSFSLIGKEVVINNGDEDVTGVVDKVKFSNGKINVVIGDNEYDINNLIEVRNEE